jgi:hypothetical protein
MKAALCSLALVIALSLSVDANSQETDNQSQDVEVVEVYGSKPYKAWKQEFLDSRDEVRNYINDSISNTDFKIKCRRVSIPNSNFKERVCSSGYDTRIKRELFEDAFFLGAGGFYVAQRVADSGSTENRKKREEHLAIIEKIYVEDEKFRELFHKHKQIEAGYQKAHVVKFGSLSQFNDNLESDQENEQ